MEQAECTFSVLKRLKSMGVRVTVDDFGTGYSSLSYLTRFPVDALKLDRSFVTNVTTSKEDAAIVRAVITMGKSLEQRVIAEGVETHEQFVFLKDQGCDEGQGHYFSVPVIPQRFTALLANKTFSVANSF
jgi:EAL domain-containing protein (putative c-di-GMP-specific phosphodiesterase class I)